MMGGDLNGCLSGVMDASPCLCSTRWYETTCALEGSFAFVSTSYVVCGVLLFLSARQVVRVPACLLSCPRYRERGLVIVRGVFRVFSTVTRMLPRHYRVPNGARSSKL